MRKIHNLCYSQNITRLLVVWKRTVCISVHTTGACEGSGVIAPHFLSLSTCRRLAVSCTLRPLYARRKIYW